MTRLSLVLLAMSAAKLGAQGVVIPRDGEASQRGYGVRPTTDRIRLDARFAEAVWQTVDSITNFRQREPLEGAPASERTVVKIVRDAERLYVAVRAYDGEIARLRSSQLRRDADLSSDDNVTILIDSYRDRRGAFLFRTNPNGAMWDAQLTGLDNLNENWNGIWEVATRRDSVSWSAEFAIPLRTLRFNPGNDLIGLNVRRMIRRKNEEDLWRSWGRTQGLDNLMNTGDGGGFGELRPDRPLELRPYVLGRMVAPSYDSAGARAAPSQIAGKLGIDAKLALTPTLTSDLTLNTDFAQVEADQQVINLTRFPTFFPEKREFFLESSGLFDIGTPQRTQLFYSRRIGLDSTGAPVPILGGARVYGKAGQWGIGLLDARTSGGENANDLALRLGRDLLERSTIVGMLVDRTRPGMRSESGAGVDLDFPLVVSGRNLEPHFWLMGTRTSVASGTPLAWRISTDAPNDLVDAFVSLYSIDSGFNPTMGFVRRTGIWETTGHIDFQPRPGRLGIRQLDLTPIPSWDIITDRSGTLTRPSTWQTADFEWHVLGGVLQSGDQFELNVRRELDAPVEAFEIFRGTAVQPGRYWWTTADVQYATSSGRPLSGEAIV
ncbi:MAG: carbohydrate binding family 9 domain-containing protein, partial [Acidobacteriota bacterium]|nr:carbohydrate binding family 9 domain-containing protein [Acidobacteriota bacterium]